MIENSPKGIQNILGRLWKCGYDAYLVGGCVRDRLLGFEAHDYDVTTNALPEQIISCFPDCKVIETGIKHGTVTVIWEKEPCEITTYRIDGEYTDKRRPDSVMFSDKLSSDLSRRDFTVNAMAYGPSGLVDLFGGREDLKNGIIRAVGEPERRFSEDALRIMRALRFSSRLGFEIEEGTASAMRECALLMSHVARERICSELVGIVMGKDAHRVTCDYADVLAFAVGVTRPVPEDIPFDAEIRLAALLSDNVEAVQDLKMSRAMSECVTALIENSHVILPSDLPSAQNLIRRFGYDIAYKLCLLYGTEAECELIRTVKRKRLPGRICDLAVRGDDIMRLGYEGAEISRMLNLALDGVISGDCKNTKENIISYIADKRYK